MLQDVNGGKKATFKTTTELCMKNLKINHLLKAKLDKQGSERAWIQNQEVK